MIKSKQTLLYIFFCIEMVMFVFFYSFGTYGLQVLHYLAQENDVLRNKNNQIKKEIQQLEQECEEWEHSSFYKEKIARERLQMARQDDVIYYLD